MIEKEVTFSEMLRLKRSSNPKEMLYDDSEAWENSDEDTTTHFEYRVETEILK